AESDERPKHQAPPPRPFGRLGEEPLSVEPGPFPGDGKQVQEDDWGHLVEVDLPQNADGVARSPQDPGDSLEVVLRKFRVEPQLGECGPYGLPPVNLRLVEDHRPAVSVTLSLQFAMQRPARTLSTNSGRLPMSSSPSGLRPDLRHVAR